MRMETRGMPFRFDVRRSYVLNSEIHGVSPADGRHRDRGGGAESDTTGDGTEVNSSRRSHHVARWGESLWASRDVGIAYYIGGQ